MSMSKSLSILVVDDDRGWLEIFAGELKKFGYQVTSSDNASDAVQFIKHENFDVVICDVKIGFELDTGEVDTEGGLHIAEIVKEYSVLTEVIVITGYGTTDLVRRSFQEGIFDFVEKSRGTVADVRKVLSEIENHRQENIANTKVLSIPSKAQSEKGIRVESDTLTIELLGAWTASDFIRLLESFRGLYFVSVATNERVLAKPESSNSQYVRRLIAAVDAGFIETSVNTLHVRKIEYASPGLINFSGIAEAIKELREFFEGVILIVYRFKREKVKLQMESEELISKQLENADKRSQIKSKQISDELSNEVMKIEVVQKKMKLWKSLGFDDRDIIRMVGEYQKNMYEIMSLIDEGKISIERNEHLE